MSTKSVPPPGPAAPSERGAKSRERLLEVAEAELVETGDLEVASVARRAGVSVGLPYRYFGTRSGLLQAVVEGFYDRLDDAVTMRRFEGASWQQRERARVAAWVEHVYSDPMVPLIYSWMGGDAEVAGAETRRVFQMIELGAQNIAQGQQAGDLPAGRDPQLLAGAVLGGLRTMSVLALERDPRPDPEQMTDELWDFVVGAVSSPRQRSSQTEADAPSTTTS